MVGVAHVAKKVKAGRPYIRLWHDGAVWRMDGEAVDHCAARVWLRDGVKAGAVRAAAELSDWKPRPGPKLLYVNRAKVREAIKSVERRLGWRAPRGTESGGAGAPQC